MKENLSMSNFTLNQMYASFYVTFSNLLQVVPT